ncbi:hypothetical protein OKW40_001012 [Paraburkholderia sp. RAU6.4a]|nr:hypothetical protein [Paraburkholderia sp. HC6.4b]MBB5453839.1 hypothetical protein [Paraburkholderia sp. Kb1A]
MAMDTLALLPPVHVTAANEPQTCQLANWRVEFRKPPVRLSGGARR